MAAARTEDAARQAAEQVTDLVARWNDPEQVILRGYHLATAQVRRLAELERRWNDPDALRRRLDELSGRAMSYVAVFAALHLVGAATWSVVDLLT